MHLIPIPFGDEILETIGRKAEELGISNAAIVSLIGMVDTCAVSSMSKDDHTCDIVTQYDQPLELAGVGELRNGTVHIHAMLGAEGNAAISGHLVRAKAGASSTNAYVVPLV